MNRMTQIEYDNFRDALYKSSLEPNDMVNVQCCYYDNNRELQYCNKVHSVYSLIWERPGFCYMYLFKPQTYMYFTWKAYPTIETIEKNGFIWHVKPYRGQFAPIYNWNDLVAMKKYGTRTISIGEVEVYL